MASRQRKGDLGRYAKHHACRGLDDLLMTIHESPWEMCASGCRDWMGLRRGFTSGQRERENPLLRPTAQPGISPRNPHTSRSLRRAMAVNQAKDDPCKPDHIDRRLCYPDRLMKRDPSMYELAHVLTGRILGGTRQARSKRYPAPRLSSGSSQHSCYSSMGRRFRC